MTEVRRLWCVHRACASSLSRTMVSPRPEPLRAFVISNRLYGGDAESATKPYNLSQLLKYIAHKHICRNVFWKRKNLCNRYKLKSKSRSRQREEMCDFQKFVCSISNTGWHQLDPLNLKRATWPMWLFKYMYITTTKIWRPTRRNLPTTVISSMSPRGAVAQSVERATPGEEVPGSIPAVAARSLLVGWVSVQCDRLRQKSWSPSSVSCVAARKIARRSVLGPVRDIT